MTCWGAGRKWFSNAASQIRPEFLVASVYRKSATALALRTTTPEQARRDFFLAGHDGMASHTLDLEDLFAGSRILCHDG
jgi:hypothetical protein